MQIRTMENAEAAHPHHLPAAGFTARTRWTRRTAPIFHQIEGLVVDKGVTFSDLKGTLEPFIKKLYGEEHARPLPPAPLPLHRAVLPRWT